MFNFAIRSPFKVHCKENERKLFLRCTLRCKHTLVNLVKVTTSHWFNLDSHTQPMKGFWNSKDSRELYTSDHFVWLSFCKQNWLREWIENLQGDLFLDSKLFYQWMRKYIFNRLSPYLLHIFTLVHRVLLRNMHMYNNFPHFFISQTKIHSRKYF